MSNLTRKEPECMQGPFAGKIGPHCIIIIFFFYPAHFVASVCYFMAGMFVVNHHRGHLPHSRCKVEPVVYTDDSE